MSAKTRKRRRDDDESDSDSSSDSESGSSHTSESDTGSNPRSRTPEPVRTSHHYRKTDNQLRSHRVTTSVVKADRRARNPPPKSKPVRPRKRHLLRIESEDEDAGPSEDADDEECDGDADDEEVDEDFGKFMGFSGPNGDGSPIFSKDPLFKPLQSTYTSVRYVCGEFYTDYNLTD